MITILQEFDNSMKWIKNNFIYSFLAQNFINQRPFSQDVKLDINMSKNIVKASELNNVTVDTVNEYGNSIRRHLLNDVLIAYERYSMLMYVSHSNGQIRTDPALLDDRTLGAHQFEQISDIYSADDISFFTQLRRLRNSIVHYNGVYSKTNQLDYTFGTESYSSNGNEGNSLSIEFDNLIWIYESMLEKVQNGNKNYFANYPLP